MSDNPEIDLAYEFVQYTNRNIFLTGKAGTGKTTFLRSLKEKSQKRMVVVAPTGVAAINAGGVTIHSFFQLPFGPILTEKVSGQKIQNPNFQQKFNKRKINIIKSLDLVVIDEISMVRADVLDAIDETLRKYKNRFLPFGGAQLLMIGDLQQLSPVVKDDEWSMLRKYYSSMFFFHSRALQEANMITIELQHVYRQKDDHFLHILNEIRENTLSEKSYNLLLTRYLPDFRPDEKDGYITLTTHNHLASTINQEHLGRLKVKSKIFTASTKGNFSEHSYPTDFDLELKIGAQVMFVKNDSNLEKRYFNGKIGTITAFEDDYIVVSCEGDAEDIYTDREVWENIKYTINDSTQEIAEEIVGSFIQYPLRLAWAITIHKSQGLTFDHAIIDAAAAFAHGQTYVALSRCRTLEGLVLSSTISASAIICDREVSTFNESFRDNQPNVESLKEAKLAYQFELVQELFTYKQLYYRVQRLQKLMVEHKLIIQGNLLENVDEIVKKSLPELAGIAEKFILQLRRISIENADLEQNKQSQERIKKASVYFYDFNDSNFVKKLKNSIFECDNTAVTKSIGEVLEIIMEILNVKQHCLKSCQKGFQLIEFLNVRAKAMISADVKEKKVKIEYKDVETAHPKLYSMLKTWRRAEADNRMVALYQVASQKMLQGIANTLPTTPKQLIKIKGIGKVKAAQYGMELIEIVDEYMLEHGIKAEADEIEIDIPKPKKVSNHQKSYELYLKGMSIADIAKELGFVVSTIENHLQKYIHTGEIKITDLMSQEIINDITACLKGNTAMLASEAKAALPQSISYGQIKFVKTWLEYKKSLE